MHALGKMLRGRKAGTSPFVCTYRAHVAGTGRAGVHKVHAASFLCSSEDSLQEECTLCGIKKFEVILTLCHKARIQTS